MLDVPPEAELNNGASPKTALKLLANKLNVVETLLLLHHRTDEVTLHHYSLLKQQNAADQLVKIVPITFPEYAAQALPGS